MLSAGDFTLISSVFQGCIKFIKSVGGRILSYEEGKAAGKNITWKKGKGEAISFSF